MKILALEFSSAQRSVAILDARPAVAGDGAHELRSQTPGVLGEVVETGGLATRALGMIGEALRQTQVEREHIECVAVGLGPGSYTGIRAAIALAQGWQLARGVKLLGLSTAECLAVQAQADGLSGHVAVVIDAQRNEFYLAGYELAPDTRRPLQPLRLASRTEVQECLDRGNLLIGPEVTNWFPAGRVIFPRAATLGRLALGGADFVPGEKLEPIYLRETQFVKIPPPRIYPSQPGP
jgi:tRNA threonylcarbamoyl adenosine modification protein YeaZ